MQCFIRILRVKNGSLCIVAWALWRLGVPEKSARGVLFRVLSAVSLSPLWGSRAGNAVRKPCHARPESAAHVAGFGLYLEDFGPPNLPEGFFDSLGRPVKGRLLLLGAL